MEPSRSAFETAYSLFKRYADNSPDMAISLVDPFFLTWFLIALFIWRVTTPIWQAIRHPLPVALAIGACTFAMVTLGVMVGRGIGAVAGRRAEALGGLVLVGIGVGILVQHLGARGAGL